MRGRGTAETGRRDGGGGVPDLMKGTAKAFRGPLVAVCRTKAARLPTTVPSLPAATERNTTIDWRIWIHVAAPDRLPPPIGAMEGSN